MKRSCTNALAILSVLFSSALAQVPPPIINYQGRLVDGGALVNGNVELVLRLYNDVTAGTLEYEDSNAVVVVDGLYSTFIGDDTLSGSLQNALTNAEVWVETEVDGTILLPRQRLASVAYALMAAGGGDFVEKTGDTMTGELYINADEGALVIGSTGMAVRIGNSAVATTSGTAIGLDANAASAGVAVGRLANGASQGAALGYNANANDGSVAIGANSIAINGSSVAVGNGANGSGVGAAVGHQAKAASGGAALGRRANANNAGVALGDYANGYNSGTAAGAEANAANSGVALGRYANGSLYGTAIGRSSLAYSEAIAVGYAATGTFRSVVAGYTASASDYGVAVGNYAFANKESVALGNQANAAGSDRIAIGNRVVNTQEAGTVVMRGSLYLDGGTSVFYRSTFGSGPWQEFSGGGEPETDPVWSSASNLYYQNAESDDLFVDASGDTMTGTLFINADGGALVIGSTGLETRVGGDAVASGSGTAVGREANAYSTGTAVGYGANGTDDGTAVGHTTTAADNGSAVGYRANASLSGAALGSFAVAPADGAAVGAGANGSYQGAALGREANALGTNIAIGAYANAAGGTGRTAIGPSLINEIDNSTAVRGSLYLDGGTSVYYRSNFGSGAWQELSTSGGSITETDPVFAASAAAGITATDTDHWHTAHAWGNHASAGYSTGTPLYTFSETDPVWEAEKAGYATGTPLYVYIETDPAGTGYVQKVGDTMTGQLKIEGSTLSVSNREDRGFGQRPLLTISGGDDIEIGGGANAYRSGAAVGYQANANIFGAALGYQADGSDGGAVIGYQASARSDGVAAGMQASALTGGTALGYQSVATNYGVAVGASSRGSRYGTAVGRTANGRLYGVAVGHGANGADAGTALGYAADGSSTNIAIGRNADAQAGIQRIAIGNDIINSNDNSVALRGTLYLDGATGILYRSGFRTGSWQNMLGAYATGTPLYAYTETDPVWAAEKGGYATGTPLYAFTEVDPVWAAASNAIQSQISSLDTAKVSKTGDTMTGVLNINVGAGNELIIGSTGVNVSVGREANAYNEGVAVGYLANGSTAGAAVGEYAKADTAGAALGRSANGYSYGAAVGDAANGTSYGAALGRSTDGSGSGVAVGRSANGAGEGVGLGYLANGASYGVAIGSHAGASPRGVAAGLYASGADYGAAVGESSVGATHGAAVGNQANGYSYGAAVGDGARANSYGAALGYIANGMVYGAAVGNNANGRYDGVAIGRGTYGSYTNIAIGYQANAGNDVTASNRIAIGRSVNNDVNDSARLRGTLYLDGGTAVMYRTSFGSGTWSNLLEGIGAAETDPVWTAASNLYYFKSQADAIFATGTPLYVYTETDPIWTAVSNSIQSQISTLNTAKVSIAGDTMTGALTNSAGFYGSITLAGTGPTELGTLRYESGTVQFYDGTNWIPVNAYAP